MTIEEIYEKKYGFAPVDDYRRRIRGGCDSVCANKIINRRIKEIWDCLKNKDGFFPENEKYIPKEFL